MLMAMVMIIFNVIISTVITIMIMTLIVNRDDLPDHLEHDGDDEE